jgi:hypothetical protein
MWFEHNPVYYGHPYNYPFVSSLISGLLVRAGLDPLSALTLPSVVTSILLLIVLYLFYYRIFRHSAPACAAVFLFLLSGGLGFIHFIQDAAKKFSWHALLHPARDYTYMEESGIFFRSLAHAQLIPQRGFLLGLPLTLAVMLGLHRLQRKEGGSPHFGALFTLGLAAGFMPIIHAHSYFVLVIVCLCMLIASPRDYKSFLAFGAGAALTSAGIYLALHRHTVGERWLGLLWGWKHDVRKVGLWGFARFWLMNWGLLLPLALWGTLQLKLYASPFVLAGWLLFGLGNLVRFQPWDMDNAKILTWSYLLLVIPVAGILTWLLKARLVGRVVVACCVLILTASCALDWLKLLQSKPTSYEMWPRSKVEMASALRKMLKPGEVVLTDDSHLNWVASLAGGQILMGYRGWLWTYGINYSSREKEIKSMYSGSDDCEKLFRAYHIRYVVISSAAKKNFGANEAFFASNYRLVLSDHEAKVFEVTL